MPCDCEPIRFRRNLTSNIKLVTPNGEVTGADIVNNEDENFDAIGYVPHWATCSSPDRFRKEINEFRFI